MGWLLRGHEAEREQRGWYTETTYAVVTLENVGRAWTIGQNSYEL
jgi:hypothetical protein